MAMPDVGYWSCRFLQFCIDIFKFINNNNQKFFLKDGSTIAIRPSGTEPKCKFYYGAVGQTEDDVTSKTVRMHKAVLSFLGL